MPSGLADYFEGKMLGLMFGSRAFTPPATYYLGLWTTTLSDPSTGSTAGEVSGGSYARVSVTNNSANFDDPAGQGATQNTLLLTWPLATAAWGTVTYVGICDAATAGNLVGYASFASPIVVSQYDTVIFQPGDLDITLT